MVRDQQIYPIIFIASLTTLAYEITLTRMFSVSLWYHFAFMVISIAMLGLATSGTILTIFSKLKKLSYLDIYCFLLGFSCISGYLIANQIPFDPVKIQWSKIQIIYIGCYYLILAFPFFFTGLIIATVFSLYSKKSALLYGFDLIGAGIGSVGILFLMKIKGPEFSIFIISSIVFILSIIIGGKKIKTISILMLIILISLAVFQPKFTSIRISPFKEMKTSLQYPHSYHIKTYHSPFSRIDVFESPAVRFAPGLSLQYLEPLPHQIGFSIDGNNINALTCARDKKKLNFLKYLPGALAYEINEKKDVFIIDPGGGLPILTANIYKAKNIYKIESHPLILEIIKKDYHDFSGNIYRNNTWQGLGRSWLQSHSKKFDLIDISLMKSIPSGISGFSENYQLTVESFKEYIKHLKPAGMINLSLFIVPPPRIEFRLLNTLIESAKSFKIENCSQHIVILRSWGSIAIIFKRIPLNHQDITKIKEFSRTRMFDLIHYPGIKPEETSIYIRSANKNYLQSFKTILNNQTRKKFTSDFIFDINPVFDDKPFFSYFLKFKNIKKIYHLIGKKWEYFIKEGYILSFILFQVILISLVLILLPVIFKKSINKVKKNKIHKKKSSILFYFACLGAGFMFIEISLMQKCILIFPQPQYAIAAVLTAILISSGCGSLLSQYFKILQKPVTILFIALIIILYIYIFVPFGNISTSLPLWSKFILTFIFLFPIGILLGIPFPLGIKHLGSLNPKLIPWAWAVNGCLSVLGPIMTMLIALSYGYTAVLWLASIFYLLAFICFRILKNS